VHNTQFPPFQLSFAVASTAMAEFKTWNKRPESIIAQNFAADLDAMFGLTPEMEQLNNSVQEKKHTVTKVEQELQALEARLREAEQRLAKVSRDSSPAPSRATPTPPTDAGDATLKPSPLAQKPTYPADRPVTADRPRTGRADNRTVVNGMPGAMPNEYVVVERESRAVQA